MTEHQESTKADGPAEGSTRSVPVEPASTAAGVHRQEAADAMDRCHARIDHSIERVERLAKRSALYGNAMVRQEIRHSARELAEHEAAAERENERRASRREDALDEEATRESVAGMLEDGWTAGELAEVGITPALLSRLGLDGPRRGDG